MVGFSSLFYGVPDIFAGFALFAAAGFGDGLGAYIGLFALGRGLMTIAGGGFADPSANSYKLFYGGGDFLIAAALLPSEFAWFFFLRGIASVAGLVM